MEEFNKSILCNAERLLKDATVLHENGRHASSIGLAVLSMEEVGKFILLEWEAGEPHLKSLRNGLSYHRAKQTALGALFNAADALDALREFLSRHGGKNFCLVTKEEAEARGLFPLSEEQRSMKLEFHEGTEEFVAERLASSKNRHIVSQALVGVFEKLKHLAFYVDEQTNEDLKDWCYSEKDAADILQYARQAHELLDLEVRLRMAREIYKSALARAN